MVSVSAALAESTNNSQELFGPWVILWGAELLLLLGLSCNPSYILTPGLKLPVRWLPDFSHYKASRGILCWSKFSLLPIFHWVLLMRKFQW